MCKLDKKSGDTRIDPCIKEGIDFLNFTLKKHLNIVACCCGHGKYAPSIVIENTSLDFEEGAIFELFSMKVISRKKRFYIKDKQGYYYIPEVLGELK